MNDVERHIQQTTDRLHCIQQHLSIKASFQSAARELLEWCLDDRAFQPHFEVSLFNCLTVVSKVASLPGFDLDLGYRLLAVCGAHKDKFTLKSSGLLGSWCEELGQLLLQRQQMRQLTPAEIKTEDGVINSTLEEKPTSNGILPQPDLIQNDLMTCDTSSWSMTSKQMLSPSWDSNPGIAELDPDSFNPSMSHGQQPYPQQLSQHQQQHPNFPKSPYSQNMMTNAGHNQLNGYPPTPTTPGSCQTSLSDVSPPVEPVSVTSAPLSGIGTMASQVWQSQEISRPSFSRYNNHQPQIYAGMDMCNAPYYCPPGNPYSPYNQPSRMPGQHPGFGNYTMVGNRPMPDYRSMPCRTGVYSGRQQVGPYPCDPQQYIRAKRGMCPTAQQFGAYRMQHIPQPCFSHQMPPSSAINCLPGQPRMAGPYDLPNRLQQRLVHPVAQGQSFNYPPPDYSHQPSYQVYNSTALPNLPGNPTPPVTPGSTHVPHALDTKPNLKDLKSNIDMTSSINGVQRMTFPVHDGIVMAPFRLEHNLAVSNHVFHLNESIYQALISRSDLELQLKCFHHEDRHMTTNWPTSVMVSVNATPMNIELQRPLNVKEVCHMGRNTVQITVTACCCSHMFVLHLVHRPTIKSVIRGLLQNNLVPADKHFTKLSAVEGGVHSSAINETTKISLKCPMSLERLVLPARGQECIHLQWFDLETYLHLNSERPIWKCPICKKPSMLDGLEINQFLWSILETLKDTECDEVVVDSAHTWTPLPHGVKEENAENRSAKSFSLSTMTLPSIDTWVAGSYSSQVASTMSMGGCTRDSWTVHGNSKAPDILTSLAQMGESLVDPRMQQSSYSILPSSGAGLIEKQTVNSCYVPDGITKNCSGGSLPPLYINRPPSNCADVSHCADEGRKQKLVACSTRDYPTSVESNTKPTTSSDTDKHDSGIEMLPENIEDPGELLTYLGPGDTDFNADDDLLSLFLPD